MIVLELSCQGLGVPKAQLTAPERQILEGAMSVVAEEVNRVFKKGGCGENPHCVCTGHYLEVVLTELSSMRTRATITLIRGHVLRHNCGAFYSWDEWLKLPEVLREDRRSLLASDGRTNVRLPMRTCSCGHRIGYGDLSVTHAHELCTAKGGVA